jgi:tetratricopeptide (TPR) repeat protein
MVLSYMGRSEDALEAAAQALRLQSRSTLRGLFHVVIADVVAGRYKEARAPLEHYISRYPNKLDTHLLLAVVYSELGQAVEARAEAAEVLRLNPHGEYAGLDTWVHLRYPLFHGHDMAGTRTEIRPPDDACRV